MHLMVQTVGKEYDKVLKIALEHDMFRSRLFSNLQLDNEEVS